MTKHKALLYIRGLPADVISDFKVYCAQKNLSMTKMVIDLIKQALDKDKKSAKNN